MSIHDDMAALVREAGQIVLSARDIWAHTHEKTSAADLVTEYDEAVEAFLKDVYKRQPGGQRLHYIRRRTMAITVHLSEILKERGVTAKELCAQVGITEANLSILRSGKANGVRFHTINQMCIRDRKTTSSAISPPA